MWIFFALLSRFMWAGCNALDQVLSRVHAGSAVIPSVVLNFCCTLPFSILAFAFSDKNFSSFAGVMPWVVAGVAASIAAGIPYFKCVQMDEARNIVPFFELTPVFLTILACLTRHEVLSVFALAGGALVIICGFLFSWDFKLGRVKGRILAYMALSSFLYAVYQLSARNVSDGRDIWMASALILGFEAGLGIVAFIVMPQTRRAIVAGVKATNGGNAILAIASNGLSFLALASIMQAFNLAPTTAHVAALSGTQPFFSFLLAAILAKASPGHFQNFAFDGETQMKLGLLAGIFIGIYMLVRG